MLEVDEAISPLGCLDGQQNGSGRPLSAPLTDEMWQLSVINVIMFILSLRSAVCPTIGDHITASSWKIRPPSKERHFIFCVHVLPVVCVRVITRVLEGERDIYIVCDGGIDQSQPP